MFKVLPFTYLFVLQVVPESPIFPSHHQVPDISSSTLVVLAISALCALMIIGNGCTITALVAQPHMRGVTCYSYFASLAVTGILLGLNLIITVMRSGFVMCLITQALIAFIQFSSLSHHILISFDRVHAVYKPISYRNRKRKGLQTAISILFVWSFSFIETALKILILNSRNKKTVMCEVKTVFGNRVNQFYVYSFGRFIVSHVIIFFNYVIMFHCMKKHRRVVAPQRSEGTESQSVNASESGIARNLPVRQQSIERVEGSQNCYCDCVRVHYLLPAYGDGLSIEHCWNSSPFICSKPLQIFAHTKFCIESNCV